MMPLGACQWFDQEVSETWLIPYDAYPALRSFTARFPSTCVNCPTTSVECSSLLLVPDGWLLVPGPNGSYRSEWFTFPIRRSFDDSS